MKSTFIAMRVPRGDREREKAAASVAQACRTSGYTPFVAYQEIIARDLTSPYDFMPFVRAQLRRSDLAIILYEPDLRGGLIEEGIAYALGIPVWLAHKRGERVSSSACGCADRILEYETLEGLADQIKLAYQANKRENEL